MSDELLYVHASSLPAWSCSLPMMLASVYSTHICMVEFDVLAVWLALIDSWCYSSRMIPVTSSWQYMHGLISKLTAVCQVDTAEDVDCMDIYIYCRATALQ